MSLSILRHNSCNLTRTVGTRGIAQMNTNWKTKNDVVYIKNLELFATVGADAWNQVSKQKLLMSLKMATDFQQASNNDDLNYTLNYAVISKNVENFINNHAHRSWNSLGSLSRDLSKFLLTEFKGIQELNLISRLKGSHLRCDNVSIIVNENRKNENLLDYLRISNLHLLTLIGVFPFERLQKQNIILDIIVPWRKNDAFQPNHKDIIDKVVEYVESSNFLTVEALVGNVAKVVSLDPYFKKFTDKEKETQKISVKVLKLNAITQTEGVGVSCNKNLIELDRVRLSTINENNGIENGQKHFDLSHEVIYHNECIDNVDVNTVYLAFGSNVGDVFSNIVEAIKILSTTDNVKVTKISSLFQSNPMYFNDQRKFINGTLEIKTNLSPDQVLKLCKKIEYEDLKRVKHFDNGPRSIDLDIILFKDSKGKDMIVNTESLTVPHPRMLDRTFVLEPLCELIDSNYVHPLTTEPILRHLRSLYEKQDYSNLLWKVNPIINSKLVNNVGEKERFMKFKTGIKLDSITKRLVRQTISPTYLMSIVNTTPDSFSDGGHIYNELEKQIFYISEICKRTEKFNEQIIFDIGGCSTRPNSIQVTEEEELARTIPLIKAIRNSETLDQERIILSIDTYRAEVAKQAIEAGVDIVNDISGGTFDPKLFDVIAENPQISYVLSHIRGDTSTMSKMNSYISTPSQQYDNVREYIYDQNVSDTTDYPVIRSIGYELAKRYQIALNKGIKRWQIIIDPGLGFSKKGNQNLEVIKNLPLLKNYSIELPSIENNSLDVVNFLNLPVLIGPSRKKFIGDITSDSEPLKRDFATGAVVMSCVGFDVNIIRVHNAVECSKVLMIGERLYRSNFLE